MTRRKIKKKKKDRELDYVEKLEKDIRELKLINRSLLKRLKKLDRDFHKLEDLEKELEEQLVKEDHNKKRNDLCSQCGKGKVTEIPLGPKKLRKCNNCDWKQTQKA